MVVPLGSVCFLLISVVWRWSGGVWSEVSGGGLVVCVLVWSEVCGEMRWLYGCLPA